MPVRTTVFRLKGVQAVRLPKGVAFADGVREVVVLREGERRVLVSGVWDDFFDGLGVEMPEREQPVEQGREAF